MVFAPEAATRFGKTVEEGLEKLAADLANDPETRAKVEAAKQEILANPAVGDWWTGIWEQLRQSLIETARNPDKVKNLVVTITPVDFHAGAKDAPLHHGLIGLWARSMTREDVDRLIEANGNLPGELMSFVFSMMTPVNAMTKYNLGLFDVMDDEKKLLNFLRMEKWLADRPAHPGEAAKQWLKDLYQDNQLVKGTFKLGGEKVNLKKITMPVLNVFAEEDHIIPPKSSQALKSQVGTRDYTELPLPGGHVGVFVSGKSQGILGKNIYGWLKKHS